MVLNLLAVEETDLGRKYVSTAVNDTALALSAVSLSTAGGREEDLLLGKGVEQVSSRSYLYNLLAFVDVDFDLALRSEPCLDEQEQGHEDKYHDDHYGHCCYYSFCHDKYPPLLK